MTIRALKCLVFGHEDHRRTAEHRTWLECQHCRRETPGWRDDEIPKPRVLYGRPVRRKFRLLKPRKTA